MHAPLDPFAYHPELRELITDPLTSWFRSFTVAAMAERARVHGLPVDWWHGEEEREALRAKALAQHDVGDLWVFGYGSLMWDPAFRFAEVRRAWVPGYARRFILKNVTGGRGTVEAPGLMAALDKGPGCHGLAFRIAREHVEQETEILWRREQIGPGYIATFVDAEVASERLNALTFVADHEAPSIEPNLTRAEQVRYIATGTGFLGSSRDYLQAIVRNFTALGIHDEETVALLREVDAYAKATTT